MHFTHWSVMIDIAFWTTLAKKKIEEFKLSSSQHTLVAKYRLTNKPDKMSILSIDAFSFLEHHD